MSIIIDRLAVIGVGLIGGSFACALREAGAVGTIIGIDSDPENLKKALELGIIDRIACCTAEGVESADVVFISIPVCSIPALVREIVPFLKPGCIVTDGGSVKAVIVRECEEVRLPELSIQALLLPFHPFTEENVAFLLPPQALILTPRKLLYASGRLPGLMSALWSRNIMTGSLRKFLICRILLLMPWCMR